MSEDKTEIPGNEEPTEGLEPSKAPTTNPMLEAILAKVNAIGEDLSGFRSDVNARFSKVDSRLDTIEKDIKEIKRNQRVFHNQLLVVEGKQLEIEEELERRAS
jgi:septation ring formation regulator EzrA